MMKKTIHIKDELIGTRLDALISSLVHSCSRNRSVRHICSGNVLVNSLSKKPGYKLKKGDLVHADIPDEDEENIILPEDIALDVLFEDDHIIVINKEAGMVVHPAPGNRSQTLVNALLFRLPEIKNAGMDCQRPGIVHRLDKDTSGLMVVAKTKSALNFLQKEFKQRRVGKKYLALVVGQFDEACGKIDLPIARHPVKRKLMAVNKEDGKPAITCWKVLQQYKEAALVEALLKTGRTHQIRVHFYAIDRPLIGETVYQPRRYRKQKSKIQRQMLHSHKLSFRHPYSGKKLFFKSEPPQDFQALNSSFSEAGV